MPSRTRWPCSHGSSPPQSRHVGSPRQIGSDWSRCSVPEVGCMTRHAAWATTAAAAAATNQAVLTATPVAVSRGLAPPAVTLQSTRPVTRCLQSLPNWKPRTIGVYSERRRHWWPCPSRRRFGTRCPTRRRLRTSITGTRRPATRLGSCRRTRSCSPRRRLVAMRGDMRGAMRGTRSQAACPGMRGQRTRSQVACPGMRGQRRQSQR